MPEFSQLSNAAAVALIVFISGLILIDCKRDIRQLVSARNVFLLTLLAWYMLEAIIVPDAIRIYSQEAFNFAIFSVSISVVCFAIGYQVAQGGIFDPTFKRLSRIDSPGLIWNVFLFALAVGFLPLLVVAKGNVLVILEDAFIPKARWSSPFQRGRFGGVRDAFLELQMFQRAALPFAAAILCFPKQRSGRRIIALAFISYMVARAVNDGTRSKSLEAILPVLGAIYWRMSPFLKRRALFIGLPLFVVFGLVWSAASVLGRNEGTLQWEKATSAEYVGFEMFRELLWLQSAVPDRAPMQYGHTYLVQLVNPIPRAIWPGKPTGDAGLLMAQIRESAQHGADLTISPGLIGEMYWNFHIPGIVILSAFCGYLAKSWDRVRPFANQSLLAFTVFAAGLAIIFLSGRSFTMSTIYGLLALYVVLIFFAGRGRRRPVRRMPLNQFANQQPPVRIVEGSGQSSVGSHQ